MLVVAAAAAAALIYWGDAGIQRLTRDHVSTRLKHDADSVAAALVRGVDGAWSVDAARLGPIYERVYSGHYYRVFNASTDIRSRSLWDFRAESKMLPAGAEAEGEQAGPREQVLLTWSSGIRKSDDILTIWIAEDIAPLDTARRQYRLAAIAILAVVVALLVIAQQWMLQRAFSRLESVRSAVRDLRRGQVDSLRVADPPSEIVPLVSEINRLLVRLEGKVSRSRNAMGNLAHELKRPMHRLRRLAEQLDRRTRADVVRAIEDLETLVARELKRSRIVGVATPGRRTELDTDIPALVDALRTMYPARHIEARYPPGTVFPHDRDDMLELLGNLLDNALKHGEGVVSLDVSEDTGGWTIIVEDEGAGIPDSDINAALERGSRLDESRQGSGLGLSICDDIVREYGGSLKLSNRMPKGLSVTVRLDRAYTDDPR